MLHKIEIKIIAKKGVFPTEVQDVIADMVRDYLIEQGILIPPQSAQPSLFEEA